MSRWLIISGIWGAYAASAVFSAALSVSLVTRTCNMIGLLLCVSIQTSEIGEVKYISMGDVVRVNPEKTNGHMLR